MAVPVVTIADLVEARGGEAFSTVDEAKATYYINAISAFVASYCDLISFQEVLDDTIRTQADYYGIIELGGGPISSVASVADVDGTEVDGWTFDGSCTITGLGPFQTVDVTYTHGSDTIPEDVKAVVVEAILDLVSFRASGRLKTRTVGDVTYAFSEGQDVGVSLSANVLDRYRTTEYTWRLGAANARELIYPVNWFQTGG